MKTHIQKPKQHESHVIQSKTKAVNQAPVEQILQRFSGESGKVKGESVQREAALDEDELLQGKFESGECEKVKGEIQMKGENGKVKDKEGNLSPLTFQFLPEKNLSPNKTGLPDNLKSGIENLSGYSMDDVRVHYNSSKPAQLQALAYTQGSDIHVAPGQEKQLPHEAWHVVQQMQGRVQPTMQLQGVNVNDNEGLEKEADVMGNTVQLKQSIQLYKYNKRQYISEQSGNHICQFNNVIQREEGLKKGEYVYVNNKGPGVIKQIVYPKYQVVLEDGKLVWPEQQHVIKIKGKGTFEIFDFTTPEQFEQEDKSFKIFAGDAKVEKDSEIVIGVADTGVHSSSEYLKDHFKEVLDVIGVEKERYHDSLIDFHGTKVAGQAIYGASNIKFIDIRVQESGPCNEEEKTNRYLKIKQEFKNAIQKGAKIITCSVALEWNLLNDLVVQYKDVLFIMTSGNDKKEFSESSQNANAILVGGVTMEGRIHPKRGYGNGIDVTVPSGKEEDISRGINLHMPIQPYLIEQRIQAISKLSLRNLKTGIDSINQLLKKEIDTQNLMIYSDIIEFNKTTPKTINKILINLPAFLKTINNSLLSILDSDLKEGCVGIKQIKIDMNLFKTRKDLVNSDIDELLKKIEEINMQQISTGFPIIVGESGVSFGIPVIANVVAKMMLLNPKLTGLDVAAIIKESYYTKEELQQIYGQGKGEIKDYSEKMLNPILAYQKALQWEK